MKNRKNLIIAFVMAALLVIGVGYAALSSQAALTTNASTTDANVVVLFDVSSLTDKNTEDNFAVATTADQDASTLEVTVTGLKLAGDSITFTINVVDASDEGLDAKISSLTPTNSNPDYFEVVYQGLEVGQVITETPSTLTVTVTLKTTPSAAQDATFAYTIEVDAYEAE